MLIVDRGYLFSQYEYWSENTECSSIFPIDEAENFKQIIESSKKVIVNTHKQYIKTSKSKWSEIMKRHL